jgi:hypothetical protein
MLKRGPLQRETKVKPIPMDMKFFRSTEGETKRGRIRNEFLEEFRMY